MAAISSAIGAIGLGAQLFGGFSASQAAGRSADIQGQIAGQEQRVEEQRHRQMLLNSRRQQLEIIRNNQRARALALSAAVNQGATQGSGLAGGLAQVSGQTGENLTANQQNLEIGENIFGINRNISGLRMQLGEARGDMVTGQGFTSLGGSLLRAGPTIGRLTQGFGNIF